MSFESSCIGRTKTEISRTWCLRPDLDRL